MYYKQVLNLKWKEFCQPIAQWTNNLKQKVTRHSLDKTGKKIEEMDDRKFPLNYRKKRSKQTSLRTQSSPPKKWMYILGEETLLPFLLSN